MSEVLIGCVSVLLVDLWFFVLIGFVCVLLVIGEIAVANGCGQALLRHKHPPTSKALRGADYGGQARIESLRFREFGNYEDITTIL